MTEKKIIEWIFDYASNAKLGLTVGISGGVDSALVSTLCAETGLITNLVSMPIHQNASELQRARSHMNWLKEKHKNVFIYEFDLTSVFENFKTLFNENFNSDLAFSNSRSRLRMTTLYQIATSTNSLVVGTGNKVEDFGIGFFTKYGDGGVDISPIADLNKTEVREMAIRLGVSEEITSAKPTDGLWEDGRTDEDQIGASYQELEWAMDFLKSDKIDSELSRRQKEVLEIYTNFNTKNQHKMLPIPVFKK